MSDILPKKFLSHYNKLCKNFWWTSSMMEIIFIQFYEKQCQPKHKGEIGLRPCLEMNKTMFSKQIWRLISDGNAF
uniref:Uncharacterized protein n=1 Tax=Nelumbo nucifera TaxID=4432 RepID=A0A822Y1R7_NELNU|nr:TPA_asm: hypothetical protein HUJ06_025061 [Nelumbo nucifera]